MIIIVFSLYPHKIIINIKEHWYWFSYLVEDHVLKKPSASTQSANSQGAIRKYSSFSSGGCTESFDKLLGAEKPYSTTPWKLK